MNGKGAALDSKQEKRVYCLKLAAAHNGYFPALKGHLTDSTDVIENHIEEWLYE